MAPHLPLFTTPLCLPPRARRPVRPPITKHGHRRVVCASRTGLPPSSTALNLEKSTNRYIDLRTMQVIQADDAHLCDAPNVAANFAIFDNLAAVNDHNLSDTLRHILFTADTIPLSDAQKDVVHNLLSGRSVLYTAAAGDEKDAIIFDIVMRSRLWKERVLYCASSHRAAEAMFAALCAQLTVERRSEVLLDLGHGLPHRFNAPSDSLEGVRVVITSPDVVRTTLVTCDDGGWITEASVLFIDSLSVSNFAIWEEILVSLPSKLLLCIFTKELSTSDKELLPLWIETVQNALVPVSPVGASSLLERIERPHNFPLLRTFVYNAAVQTVPVQVSLTLLKEMYQKELNSSDFVPQYSECFLNGITMLYAEETSSLMFRDVKEAEYADVCSLIVADAKRVFKKVKSKRKRPRATKRKERTPSSRAAARRRRDVDYSESLLFPATVLVKGRKESFSAAQAIQSAFHDESALLWDEDTKEHVKDIINSYQDAQKGQLSARDEDIFDLLKFGVGVINGSMAPAVRTVVEELFRGGFIPVIVADTRLGSDQLNALPCAKSVLLESSAMGTCDDLRQGVITTSTAAALAGRAGKDDVGNLIILYYDESVDDEDTGFSLASTLFNPLFIEEEHLISKRNRSRAYGGRERISHTLDGESLTLRGDTPDNPFSSSYDGVLRAVQRFGLDGYESVVEYTLNSFRGWLKRAALRATLEKVGIEKKAIDERLDEEDWSSIADHERREAKMNEVKRILKAMESRYHTVRANRLLNDLRGSSAGRIIGVRCPTGNADGLLLEQKLLEGKMTPQEESEEEGDEKQEEKTKPDASEARTLVKATQTRQEPMAAASFVTILDQNLQGQRIAGFECRYLVVCIMADGMWTMLPLSDMLAISEADVDVLSDVDLLMMPHPATFDKDPTTQWARCRPIDEMERKSVDSISDELISRVTGENRPILSAYTIPEYETQRERLEMVQNLHEQSPWYGRDEEIVELQRMRRRSARMSDEISWLEKTENQLEESLFAQHNEHRSIQASLMAIMEDCHALYVVGDKSMEITPLGSLAAILPSDYPLFAAACLSLIEDVERLTPSQLAGFLALVASSAEVWGSDESQLEESLEEADDEPLDLSSIRRSQDSTEIDPLYETGISPEPEIDDGDNLLPRSVTETVQEIQQALHQLHMRHLEEKYSGRMSPISNIAPAVLNSDLAEAVGAFVDGASWPDVVQELGRDSEYGIRELRRVKSILHMIGTDETLGEFAQDVRTLARAAYNAINRWPVREEETVSKLIEEGVIEKRWTGTTYDKWWRSARGSLTQICSSTDTQRRVDIESVEAEILESS